MSVLFGYLALGTGFVVTVLNNVPFLAKLLGPGTDELATFDFYRGVFVASLVLFFGPVLIGLAVVVTVPRVLGRFLKPDVVHPLYGFHYAIHRTIARMTNVKFYLTLFGDSSYIVHYLQVLGYDLSRVEQSGSNFGVEVKHETPYLASIGSGTMVSDGLSIINAHFSSTSFRVARVSIGAHSFFGNDVAYPAGGRTGDNCLFGTKVMVPIDGKIRENVGLLGSPCFEIPRSVQRDSSFDELKRPDERRRRLAAKNKHNIATMGMFLLARWFQFFVVSLLALVAADIYSDFGAAVFAGAMILILAFGVVYTVLLERLFTLFRPLSPRFCSIYDPYFWWHERFWKLSAGSFALFNGTPFKGAIWRGLGVRVRGRLYDDGCAMPEKTLVTIGKNAVLNAGTCIQCHSLEDGTFKSDRITIGDGCTIGVNAFIHYGTTIGDGAVVEADSFLMKGEEVTPYTRWGGNPAREFRHISPVVPASAAVPAVTGAALTALVASRLVSVPPTASVSPAVPALTPRASRQVVPAAASTRAVAQSARAAGAAVRAAAEAMAAVPRPSARRHQAPHKATRRAFPSDPTFASQGGSR